VSLVIDSSVTLAWIYSDERTKTTERVFDIVTEAGAWVPMIWHLEVANGLQQGIRQRRIDAAFRTGALADLAEMNIATDPDTNVFAWNDTLTLSDRFRLTLYDACYLELAQRRNLPLATLDGDLRAAGDALGIEMLGA
jgi:predicted nucleic acid-binding protein